MQRPSAPTVPGAPESGLTLGFGERVTGAADICDIRCCQRTCLYCSLSCADRVDVRIIWTGAAMSERSEPYRCLSSLLGKHRFKRLSLLHCLRVVQPCWRHVYVCIYIHIYIHMYLHTHTHNIYIYILIYIYTYIHTYICIHTYITK